jgi:predicted dehydrogenase
VTGLRWGVLGATARIYDRALEPVLTAGGHRVVAAASRGSGGDRAYAAVLEREDVDAVYVPLPNALHAEWIGSALAAGKHVLCEKPLTMSERTTAELFAAARGAGRVLMEAYMWPHHERTRRALRMVHDGVIGRAQLVRASFSFPLDDPGDHRADGRGGGALFDLGIYVTGPALLLSGREPGAAHLVSRTNPAGVDVVSAGVVDWGDGLMNVFDISFDAPQRCELEILGSEGSLTFPDYFPSGGDERTTIVLTRRGGDVLVDGFDDDDGYAGMVRHFTDLVHGTAAPLFGETESVRLARLLDRLLARTDGDPPPNR